MEEVQVTVSDEPPRAPTEASAAPASAAKTPASSSIDAQRAFLAREEAKEEAKEAPFSVEIVSIEIDSFDMD